MANVSKSRSIEFLTSEQLQRKREGDRKSQKQLRERTKSQVNELTRRVYELQNDNQRMNTELSAFRKHCKCGHGRQSQYVPRTPSSLRDSFSSIDGAADNEELSTTCDAFSTHNQSAIAARHSENWDDRTAQLDMTSAMGRNDPYLDPALWNQLLNDTMINTLEPFDVLATSMFPEMTQDGAMPMPPTPEPRDVYSTLPKHLPPTCPLDRVFIDLVRSRRPYELNGGNIQEFERDAFPKVKSLLNPTCEARKSTVTSTIIENIIYVMTVSTLPEQIAILYVMSIVIRWQISPTEAYYDSLPEWLRPTPSQIITTHPAWMDTFPWPKARERFCRYQSYHDQNPIVTKLCNASISINWPYEASDVIIPVNGGDFILNPIFERHIRTLNNWTLGKGFLEAFPELINEVNHNHLTGTNKKF